MNFTNILNYGIERNCKCNHYKSWQSLQKKKKKELIKIYKIKINSWGNFFFPAALTPLLTCRLMFYTNTPSSRNTYDM